MDYFCAFSWPYSSSAETDARHFFNKLRTGIEGGKKFPLLNPHEIALVRNPSGEIFVNILVLTGTEVDDTVETHEKVVSWLKECGAEGYEDYEILPVRGQSIQSSLGADYTVLDKLKGFRTKSEPVKKKQKASAVQDVYEGRVPHENVDQQAAVERSPEGLWWLYFSFNGRIGLQTFWLKGYLPLFVMYSLAATALVVTEANGMLYLLVQLFLFWPNLALLIKRWHDRDKSGWWVLIALIPVVGWIWTFIETGFLKGTEAPNQFGPPEVQSKEALVAHASKKTRSVKGAPELSGSESQQLFQANEQQYPKFGSYDIGVLFDIDELGGGFYGWKAYKIFFNSLDPKRLTGCTLFDGDTTETLAGRARQYCIALQSLDPSKVSYVKETLGQHIAEGLLPPRKRFIEGNVTEQHPLAVAGEIDSTGNLIVKENSMIGEGWVKGTTWTVIKR